MKKIVLFITLFTTTICIGQSVSKNSIVGKYQSGLDKFREVKEFKEFKKDGTYESHIIDNKQDVLKNAGKYIVVNDSIYLECIEHNPTAKDLEGLMLPFKYTIRNDSLRQTGIIHVKANVPSRVELFYKYKVDGYWLKIE